MATVIPPEPSPKILRRFFRRSTAGAGEELVGPIRGEVLGAERLGERARVVARQHRLLPPKRQRGPGPLLLRLENTREILDRVFHELSEGAEAGLDISPAGDWLLDNFYIVQEHIREIRTNLPEGYYQELPKLASGQLTGYPRAYEVAIELIAHTEGHLDLDNITLFVREYQKITALRMGELWAIPTMLRLGLVENIRRMALRVSARLKEVESADTAAASLRDASEKSPEALAEALSAFVDDHPAFTPTWVARFLQQVRSYQTNFTPLIWLEQWIAEDGPSAEEAATRSNRRVALTQVTVANSITSLRTIARLDWKDFVEAQSATEKVLRDDPSGHYAGMTFATRDHYRHVVEHIAKRTKRPEDAVAESALALAQDLGRDDSRRAHIGYYLVDKGRALLEERVGYTPPPREWIHRWTLRHPNTVYFGGITLFTLAILGVILEIVGAESAGAQLTVTLLALLPANEMGISIVNQLVTLLMPPRTLPKLELRENGIPPEYSTAVVVPTLFGSARAAEEAVGHIEVQYLANRETNVRFAILSDFTDAKTEHCETDEEILRAAKSGIDALNAKYSSGTDVFLLFHRPRLWNPKQRAWMGWERKRGKLAQFNQYLRGGARGVFTTIVGDPTGLENVRFVITLDSDTVLPRDAAGLLIGTIAHPLNCAEYDDAAGRIVAGYGIVQPRVGVSLTSAHRSYFAAVHSGHPGVDPYTTAVSDVYQDLYAEGSFTGKGIYDVDAFEKATHGRFPENTLLSHDLIEGTYSRAALATDIEVYDDYPARYLTFTRRKHRWIRGDWQLLDWLTPTVPGPDGPEENRLPAISRWKIFDNLRRSLVEISQVVLLLCGWFLLPGSALGWTIIVLSAIAFPWLFSLFLAAIRPPKDQSWTAYYVAVGQDAVANAQQFALAAAFLLHQAVVSADAIIRTIARLYFTKRNLLEWQTASQVERAMGSGSAREVWRKMWPVVAMCAVIAALALSHDAMLEATAGDEARFRFVLATFPLLLLWLSSPSIAAALSHPAIPGEVRLTEPERKAALRFAKLHWAFFEQFVTEETQWLSPDNFQEDPEPMMAQRTSPTNIGLQLLSTVAAADLGFIARDDMIERIEKVFRSLERMRRYRGHFFNWYELGELRVLEPGYVSTVDSGNFAGHLLALKQACYEMIREGDCTPEEVKRLNAIAERSHAYTMEMDFKFLYDDRRKLFSIGYQVGSNTVDSSYYDLLASESRLASFVAIAKDDVSVEHWFRLGRTLTGDASARTLVSWSGSMFEYLMPSLIMQTFPFTLLDQTQKGAVRQQIAYGAQRGVPWGISESAYNVRDRMHVYQYRGFGVPELALKRGLSKEVVIAPYATMLAMLVEPRQALRNMNVLEAEGALGPYGFRDAIDYTRPAPGSRKAVVNTYMAHHIGMSIVALDNALNRQTWRRRFHTDPLVRSAELVLHERIPRRLTVQDSHGDDVARVPSEMEKPAVREIETPHTPQPVIAMLGNVPFTTMITNAGGGFSKYANLALTRWRHDSTRDNYGQWCYVRDMASGQVWSATYQPTAVEPVWYRVRFASDRVTFLRRDDGIDTQTEIAVASDDGAEVRRVTLFNRTTTTREIELTSYCEVVLAPPDADRAHPAFGNLFVQTEWLEGTSTLFATRRPRSATEARMWCAHVVATGPETIGVVTCETDRAKFVGRGRSVRNPEALDVGASLTGTVGAVLDPIFALRVKVRIAANSSAQVAFTTFVADTKERALELADLYHDQYSARRALDLSWAHTQAELRDLGIAPADAALYQDLAGHLLYPHPGFRPAQSAVEQNRLGQEDLWSHGISGDWPILLATIESSVGLPSVRQLLRTHHYWRLKGITCDLVILNVHPATYLQELNDELLTTVMASSEAGLLDRPGGVFIRRTDVLKPEDVTLLKAMSRVQVTCDGLGLGNFLEFPGVEDRYPPRLDVLNRDIVPLGTAPVRPKKAASGEGLDVFNGIGGFNADGEYEIRLTGAELPPAPWVNVIGNPAGGFCVSESGCGATWAGNSFFYRLTPWHNDPVRDPSSDCIYIRDDETGSVWTPTPAPVREPVPYNVRHGQGYSVFEHNHDGVVSSLRVGMDENDAVKISILKLTNEGTTPERLTITWYVEWVLGVNREQTQYNIKTSFDEPTQAMLARNYFDPQFAQFVAFASVSEMVMSYTADRREFLGRNGTPASPAAVQRSGLSGTIGVTIDPCGVLQFPVTLAPGETKEIVMLLGAGATEAGALEILKRLREKGAASAALDRAISRWKQRLTTISVKTPEPTLDLMVNRWSLYQALSCRMWARSALYQSSGAFGFRDQLQDVMAFVYSDPDLARAHIIRAAGRQFTEGDVQHWWHPQSGRGVRTRFSDDLAWLPYVLTHYIETTGDATILDEQAQYITMRELAPDEHEIYDLPQASNESGSIYDHCLRALKKACTKGAHGLPLIGSGDWNDGFSRVGIEGKGESIWLAWFLITTLRGFAKLSSSRGDTQSRDWMLARADEYKRAVEENAWDGAWYKRAYFDDGSPLGSSTSDECKIDSIAQSWSVISGAGESSRAKTAMKSFEEHLVRDDARLLLLLKPPFDKTTHDPGYIQGYLPGVRENGAQYTHASLWSVLATALLGDGNRAMELIQMINPITRSDSPEAVQRYKVEPYVVAADVYFAEGHIGRGGWTWYTGSASWAYRVALETILGFQKRGNSLQINPCIPSDWKEFSISYRFGKTNYAITVKNPDGIQKGRTTLSLDGRALDGPLPLADDGAEHKVIATLSASPPRSDGEGKSPDR